MSHVAKAFVAYREILPVLDVLRNPLGEGLRDLEPLPEVGYGRPIVPPAEREIAQAVQEHTASPQVLGKDCVPPDAGSFFVLFLELYEDLLDEVKPPQGPKLVAEIERHEFHESLRGPAEPHGRVASLPHLCGGHFGQHTLPVRPLLARSARTARMEIPITAMLKLLGLASAETKKNLAVIRPVMELPVAPPIGEIAFENGKIPAVGLKQVLVPTDATVLGTWADGKPAVTVRELGNGKAFAVGTLAGCASMRTGLAVQPFPRCDNPFVEAIVMDGPAGSVLTLATDLEWADHILLPK